MSDQPVISELISADDHAQEPQDLWTQRLSPNRWGERVPHLETRADGTQYWVANGTTLPLVGVAATGALMADRSRVPQRWDEVPKAAYIPAERLKAMHSDGVACSVLYPTVAGSAGENFGRIEDPDLEIACVRAYNDWLIEEWAAVSKRFIPQCIVPLSSVDAIVAEIERAVRMGHKGVVFPSVPMELKNVPHINDPAYDPVWTLCQDLGIPICFHAGSFKTVQFAAHEYFHGTVRGALEALTRPASLVFVLVNLLLSRILLRFPKLKVVLAESSIGWGTYLLEYGDHQAEQDRLHLEGYPKLSEMFRRQCYLTGWYDVATLKTRTYVGSENILWSSNFPLATSTWPETREYLGRSLAGLPEDACRSILSGNAAKLYHLS
ncbi:MAG TPA: amidohydrolase family protein [Candidatus Binatia bacterium]|jgi:predicted TIM-barrel fold metal-dependent hydrolase